MLSYGAALNLVNVNGGKLENNTFIGIKDAETVAVRLYATEVVLIHADGTYTLNSGGYRTATTKDRINKYGPKVVWSKIRKWFVGNEPFVDGIKVDATGNVMEAAF